MMQAFNKKIFIGVILFVLGAVPWAEAQQGGTISESVRMYSSVLGDSVAYSVYLPAGYDENERDYPVLYLLHGFTGDESDWVQFGNVVSTANDAITSGAASPMVIIMPDAGNSWYVNSIDGDVRYEEFFVDEFMPAIERTYRIRSAKEFRAIAGLSMGGYGTLYLSMRHPEMFSAAAALSAGVITDEAIKSMPMNDWNNYFSIPYGTGVNVKQRMNGPYHANSIPEIVDESAAERLGSVRYYIDCGDDDFLIKGNMNLHAQLIDKQVPHEFRVRDGAHTWTYWRTALPEVLAFINQSFQH